MGFLIQADLTQTPDVRLKIPAAIYEARIDKVEVKDPRTKPDGTVTPGKNVVIEMTIVNHEEQAGREITHYVFIPADLKRKDALTGIKRVFLSAGIPISPQGMDTDHLVGRTILIRVDNGTFKDERSGVVKETYNVGEIYIPSDNAKPGGAVGGGHMPGQTATPMSIDAVIGGATPAPAVAAAPQAAPQPVPPTPVPVGATPVPVTSPLPVA